MPIGSRELPGCRTMRFAGPADCRVEPHDDHEIWDSPACRDSSWGHRLVLDEEPADVGPWLARWARAHGGKGLETAYLVWEARLPSQREDAAPGRLVRLRTWMFDEPLDPGPRAAVRALDRRDLDRLVAHLVEGGARAPYARWYASGLLGRVATGSGAIQGWFEGEDLVGTTAILWNEREARLQAVGVRASHRRRGVATALLTAAIAAYQAESFGITYGVVAPDGPAEGLYRSLGFRPVTWVHELAHPAPA